MRKSLRLTLVGAVAFGALAVAAPAFAKYEPQLLVNGTKPTPGAPVKIRYVAGSRAEDTVADLKVAVPKGYTTSTSAGAGTRIGSVSGQVLLIDSGRTQNISGRLAVASASDFGSLSQTCTGVASHAAVWAITFTVGNQTYRVPVFVDRITGGDTAAFASATLEICFPHADTPRGAPGRAPLGAKPLQLGVTVNAITSPSEAGVYRWRATATPYIPLQGALNSKGTVEIQSLASLPASLTLGAKVASSSKAGFKRVTVNGKLLANNQGVPGTFVELLRSGKRFAVIQTKKGGEYTATGELKSGGSLTLVARTTVPDKDLGSGGCQATFKPIPCTSATLTGFTVSSSAVRVRL